MIWRRLLVSENTSLVELHEIIQISLGWEGCHLWTFSLGGREYGHAYGEGLTREAFDTTHSDLELRLRQRFLYNYDFGDYWQHEIRLEQISEPNLNKSWRVRELITKVRLHLASGHPGQSQWLYLSRAFGGVHK